MESKLVSIVMLSWNRKDDVLYSLAQIRKNQYKNLEVIVCDNGSTDGTIEEIKAKFPEVKLIEVGDNLGIAGYNYGFEEANGEYILIIDDDSFPALDAVGKMVEKFEDEPDLGVVAFDVRNAKEYNGAVSQNKQVDKTPYEYYMGFNGAGAGVRKELFKKVGYYPSEFFLYMNEADCAIRIWDEGYKIKFFPEIISYHKQAEKNRTAWRAAFYYTRNSFWVLWKNYPLQLCVKRSLILTFYCFYSSIEQHTMIYIKALFSAIFKSKLLNGKRRPVSLDIASKMRIPLNLPFTFYN